MSDSNRPPTDYKSVALPDELMGHVAILNYLCATKGERQRSTIRLKSSFQMPKRESS